MRQTLLRLVFFSFLQLSLISGLFYILWQQAGGFAYPLDDTYIHMETGWRWLQEGVIGINPGEFSAASSSPLWMLLLSSLFVFLGHATSVPLILNVLCLIALGVVLELHLKLQSLYKKMTIYILLIFLGPTPIIASLGMEHILHCVWTLLIVTLAREPSALRSLMLVLVLSVLTRYETMFQALPLAFLLFPQSKKAASGVFIASTLPVIVFGLWMLGQGGFFLPNGLIMKSSVLSGHPLNNLLTNLKDGIPIWGLALLLLGISKAHKESLWFAGTVGLNTIFGAYGWYYRYEAWLVAWGLVLLVEQYQPMSQKWLWLPGIIVGFALGSRSLDAWRYFPGRCVYILDTKVNLARALAETTPALRLALHDIGAMAWYTDFYLIDIAGLGSTDVAQLSLSKQFTGVSISQLLADQHAELLFATASWMAQDPLPGWKPVAQLNWGLDSTRTIEPLIVYSQSEAASTTALIWIERAASNMNGRGHITTIPDNPTHP
jgi:hypothetical protein